MRIGIHADPAVHAVPGGIGVYVRRLVKKLVGTDENTYRLIVSKFAEAPPSWDPESLIRPPAPVASLYSSWNFLGRPRILEELDVIHATALAIPPCPEAALVATVHDLAVERMPQLVPALWRRVYRQGLRKAAAHADVVCSVSQSTAEELQKDFGVNPERVMVTPLAPNSTPRGRRNEAVFERLALEGPYVLTVGTVEPRKNHVGLIDAFAACADRLPEHRLVIAGIPGWGQEKATAAVERHGLPTRVSFTGKVAPAELNSLYAGASVFVLPSLYEGFGLPLIEALGFGIPSVAAEIPALRELAGDAAEVVDPTDPEALAAALVRVATDETLRARLADAGPRRAGEYSWERTARLTLEAYGKAAGR